MKTCRKCCKEYEGSSCKACKNLYKRDWTAKNPEKVKVQKKKSYEKNRVKVCAKTQEWAESNREKSNAIKKAWKERNREKYLEQQRAYALKRYQENRLQIRAKEKERTAGEAYKKWREANRQRISKLSLEKYHASDDKRKYKARQTVANALKSGKLIKPDVCEICGINGKLEAHHSDYSEPLIVNWFCIGCHKNVHSKYFKQGTPVT